MNAPLDSEGAGRFCTAPVASCWVDCADCSGAVESWAARKQATVAGSTTEAEYLHRCRRCCKRLRLAPASPQRHCIPSELRLSPSRRQLRRDHFIWRSVLPCQNRAGWIAQTPIYTRNGSPCTAVAILIFLVNTHIVRLRFATLHPAGVCNVIFGLQGYLISK